MRVIDHRQFIKSPPASWNRRVLRYCLYGLAGLAVLVALINAVMWVVYRQRVLPGYSLGGVNVSNVPYGQLSQRIAGKALPQHITLQKDAISQVYTSTALGARVDGAASLADLKKTRPVLPMMALFEPHAVPSRVTIDQPTLDTHMQDLQGIFRKDPLVKRIAFNGSAFVIAPEEDGFRLAGAGSLAKDLQAALQQGKNRVVVPVMVLSAPHASTDLAAAIKQLEKKLTLKTTFTYNGKVVQPTAKDIGNWYVNDFNVMVLSPDKIGAYLDSITPAPANRSDLALAIQYAFGKDLSSQLAVVPQGAKTRTYCTAVRAASAAAIDDMIGKLAFTYADVRGWNNSGRMAFQHVASGCEYTVWLSASSQMTSFGAICDDYYNCQVGTNVIVNEDRWNHATDPWNAAGGSLENYRTLIIDHETGHRLGFLDNPTCPGAAQPAPVMMQQSIDLKGCVFNIWPLASELTTLATNLGLPAQTASD